MQTMCIAFIAYSLENFFFIRNWMAHLRDDVLYVCLCVLGAFNCFYVSNGPNLCGPYIFQLWESCPFRWSRTLNWHSERSSRQRSVSSLWNILSLIAWGDEISLQVHFLHILGWPASCCDSTVWLLWRLKQLSAEFEQQNSKNWIIEK